MKAYAIRIKLWNCGDYLYVAEDGYKHDHLLGGSEVWATSLTEYAKLFRFQETATKKAQEIYSWFTGHKADEEKIEIISFELSNPKEEVLVEQTYIGQVYREFQEERNRKRAAKQQSRGRQQ